MTILDEDEAKKKVVDHCAELTKRARKYDLIESYRKGKHPIPSIIQRAKVTRAYRMLLEFSETNYARLIVKAASSRMEIGGIRSPDRTVSDEVWKVWQENRMDAESKRGNETVIAHGRCFAVIWPRPGDERPQITLEDPATVIVEYREGSRYDRVAATRMWVDDDKVPHATLYTPEALYKFTGPKHSSGQPGTQWTPREVPGERWPLPNRYELVPVVEIATGRELAPGRFGSACGDLEDHLSHLDRINILEFLRLVIAFTAGFPIRAVIGDKIIEDDDGNPIAPFELAADIIAQFEDPNVKLQELKATDLKGFGDALDRDVESLAGVSLTPSYYLRSIPIQNVNADAIRASDAPLNSRVADHKPEMGEGYEEVNRVAGKMLPKPVDLDDSAEVYWVNRELRSLSEKADAATKLKDVLPRQVIWEEVFDATQDQVTRWESMEMSDRFAALFDQTDDEPSVADAA